MITRRSFVRALAAMAGTLLAPLDRLASRLVPSVAQAQSTAAGELYEGFVLLPQDGAVPAIVGYPKPEELFQVDAGLELCSPLPGAMTTSLDTPNRLAEIGGFPVFTPRILPSGHRLGDISLIQYKTGETFSGSLSYESYNSVANTWENTLSITIDMHYPRPCPLWPGTPAGPDDIAATIEMVSFLPSPGVGIRSATGYVFYWIWKDVLYTMRTEFWPTYEEAVDVASSLALVDR